MKHSFNLINMRIFVIFVLTLFCVNVSAQKIDTIYYDKDGVGISTPAFASYYRVYAPNTLIGNKMRYRDFYINGTLKSEGEYTNIDPEYDNNSIFNGECVSYYESGTIKERKNLSNGILNGEYTSYYESGLVELHTFFDYGKRYGIDTYFDISTQKCYQKVMKDDEPLYDYCIISDENGYVGKVKLSN